MISGGAEVFRSNYWCAILQYALSVRKVVLVLNLVLVLKSKVP